MYLDNIFRKEIKATDYAISGLDIYETLIESTEDISKLRSEIIASEAGVVLSSESVSLASEGVGEKLKAFAKKVWEFIKNIAKKVANFFRSLASKIRDAIKKLIGKSKAAEAEAKKEDAAKGAKQEDAAKDSPKTYYREHDDDDDTVIYALATSSVTEVLEDLINVGNVEDAINEIKSFENKDIEDIKAEFSKIEETVDNSVLARLGQEMKSIPRNDVASLFVKVSTKLQANMVHKQSAYSLEKAAKLLENRANLITQTFEKAANIVKSKDSEDVNISGDEAVIQRQKKNHFIIDGMREIVKVASETSVHVASIMSRVITVCLIIINSKINGIMEDDVERCIDNIMGAYQTAGESLIRYGSKN